MSIFDGLIMVGASGEPVLNQWIEWDHFLIPNKPNWLRNILRNILAMFGHCNSCTALDGCYLVTRNMPNMPLHNHCDCRKIGIAYSKVKREAKADCDIRKFTEYVFKNTPRSKGKNKIFYDIGYDIDDSRYLQVELCKQAAEQYIAGNYVLKGLDKRGQRLAIPICLKDKHFYSGRMLCPQGQIKNTTPFGGWIK